MGVPRITTQRGGMQSLENGIVATVAAASDFETIVNDVSCSQSTYDILRDMRDLTDRFLADITKVGRLTSLPSAHAPGFPTSNDWVYEACRLAALIYTTAIIMHVPFSVAAHSYASVTRWSTKGHPITATLTEALYEALQRTDVVNIWNNMAGVLYWVCSVGAAGARRPEAIETVQRFDSREEASLIWARRCLIMHATRTMVILVFQHPVPVMLSQKRLLQVQELIATRI
ncbi:hypothetical protein CC86DRAFT_382389 [Ophiobolus disseminans]|uniref:Transcription factor domain-containing protein n=1 Tax=Ophiobolus disseminans TaxID=1469910 RepID=A0A6A6ZZ43_9PLEO|nr:hypothetical protein CC86DRAFT_382389 [Ophiobolus disseminans]